MSQFPISLNSKMMNKNPIKLKTSPIKNNALLRRRSTLRNKQFKLKELSPLLSQTQVSTTLGTIPQKVYNNFQNALTIQNVCAFAQKTRIKHLEVRSVCPSLGICLRKNHLLSVFKSTFPSHSFTNELFELIWNRFKLHKCEIKTSNRKSENYFLHDVQPKEEVNIYEIAIAFSCFIKCEMHDKVKLLYELTDADNDGFINQNELKNMIYTLNRIFSQEEATIKLDSALVYQSIASIKSYQIFNLFMKSPGELGKIFSEQHVITYEQFAEALNKIPNYKYTVFPFFVNLHTFLSPKIKEPNYNVKANSYRVFTTTTNSIVNQLKNVHALLGANQMNSDFKRNLEPLNRCNSDRNYTLFKSKKSNFIDSVSTSTKRSLKIHTDFSNNEYIKPVLTSGKSARNIREDYYEIIYSKINNLEALPGRINVIETPCKNERVNTTTSPGKNVSLYKKSTLGLGYFTSNISNIKRKDTNTYLTYPEIMNEINTQLHKHRVDEQSNEELIKLRKQISTKALSLKRELRNLSPNQNLNLERAKFIKMVSKEH